MNDQSIIVSKATATEYAKVGRFVQALLLELYPEQPEKYPAGYFVNAALKLLSADSASWAFIAKIQALPVGVITLNQCCSIYAGGEFGEISELYVLPDYRSQGVGAALLNAAFTFAAEQQWPSLEVGAPGVPQWQRTVDFYSAHGFSIVGPRLHWDVV